jgi:ADP-heptose:LPS heptosyltransferase
MFNPLYFYEDNIKEGNVIFKSEPYSDAEYTLGKKHLIDTWCDQLRLSHDQLGPELFISESELQDAKKYIESQKVNPERLILLQWQGGFDKSKPQHARDLPVVIAQKLADTLRDLGFTVWAVQVPSLPRLDNVFVPARANGACGNGSCHPGANQSQNLSLRQVFALLKLCKTFVGIDSFLQHAGAALKKPGVVLWGATSPRTLGYELHRNIPGVVCPTPSCNRPNGYLFDLDFMGRPWACPYDKTCLKHSVEVIIKEVENATRS